MWLLVVVAVAAQAPVLTEFRVFNGTEDVTGTTRLRVVPSGRRDAPAIEPSGSTVSLTPGMYDVQALRGRDPGVVSIQWAERLAVMHYPDEGGRHLEVINFQPGYGALQLRDMARRLEPTGITVFSSGDRTMPVGRPVAGDGYVLFVVPAGRYDVRVQRGDGTAGDTRWLYAVDVPVGRTRLKLVDQ